jgi:hypothetical protein
MTDTNDRLALLRLHIEQRCSSSAAEVEELIDLLTAERDQARAMSGRWKRLARRYRTMLAVHRDLTVALGTEAERWRAVAEAQRRVIEQVRGDLGLIALGMDAGPRCGSR